MDPINKIPVLILHVLEADITENTGIVEQDVNTTKILDGSLNDFVTKLDAVVIGNSLAASLLDLIDNDVGSLLGKQQLAYCGETAPQPWIPTLVELPSPLNEPPRSFTTTFAPLEPKNIAYAFPNPPPAPVITTV